MQRVPAAYRTQIDDVLLTGLAQALRAWTGRDVHRIDMERHGREEAVGPLHVSRTVGWFTTLYPVVLDLEGVREDGAALKRVKEGLRHVRDRLLEPDLDRFPLFARLRECGFSSTRASCSSSPQAGGTRRIPEPLGDRLDQQPEPCEQCVVPERLLRHDREAIGCARLRRAGRTALRPRDPSLRAGLRIRPSGAT